MQVQRSPQLFHLRDGERIMELVGHVTNFPTTPPTSHQYGYLTRLADLEALFLEAAAVRDESTARYTLFTDCVATSVVMDGTLRRVHREGSTTLYQIIAPARFAAPESFRAGTPIQLSRFTQDVVVDTLSQRFTVVNVNEISSATPFDAGDGRLLQLGEPGERFTTHLEGRMHAQGPPSGSFEGYMLGGAP